MYGNIDDALQHWTDRGYSGEPNARLLRIATTFIDGLGWKMSDSGIPVSMFPGIPTDLDQPNQWPRTRAKDKYGRILASDVVPVAVERATYEAAHYESQEQGALNAALRHDQVVKREKFSSVSFEYGDAIESGNLSLTAPVIPAVMTYLAPLLGGGENPYGITGIVA